MGKRKLNELESYFALSAQRELFSVNSFLGKPVLSCVDYERVQNLPGR